MGISHPDLSPCPKPDPTPAPTAQTSSLGVTTKVTIRVVIRVTVRAAVRLAILDTGLSAKSASEGSCLELLSFLAQDEVQHVEAILSLRLAR